MKWCLVDNWRTWPKRWSVWLGAAGTILLSWLTIWPDAVTTAWNLLPDVLRSAIPPTWTPLIAAALFAGSMIAQLIKQHKLQVDQQPKAPE